jgi:UDP-N-acetylglucosamine:LPS N-acetylglucosamine transferase
MKILLAFSDTGGGHRSAAVAIRAALEKTGADVTTEMLDALTATKFPILQHSPAHYDKLSTTGLKFYNLIFRMTDGGWRMNMLTRIVHIKSKRNVLDAIEAFSPDIIVLMHPLLQRLFSMVRRAFDLTCPIVTVVTDLVTMHAGWTYPDVDRYLVPTEEAYQVKLKRGLEPEQIQFTGFPVHPKFADYDRPQTKTRAAIGIAPDVFTILVTSGGVGSGHLNELVLALEEAHPEKQLLVVTGRNQALRDTLTAQCSNEHTHIYGFVDNMEELMAASDIVVTKAGPGTLMEALVMRRPVILTEAVGVQEYGNIDFVRDHELGLFCPTTSEVTEAVSTLSDPNRYTATVSRLSDAVPRDGAAQIAKIILEMGSTQSGR